MAPTSALRPSRHVSRPKRRRITLLLAAATAAIVALAGCSEAGTATRAGAGSGIDRPDPRSAQGLPTASALALLLPEAEFPAPPGSTYSATQRGTIRPDTSLEDLFTGVEDERCRAILAADHGDRDSATAHVSGGDTSGAASPGGSSQPDLRQSTVTKDVDAATFVSVDEMVSTCGTMPMTMMTGVDMTFAVEKIDLDLGGNGEGFKWTATSALPNTTGGTASTRLTQVMYGALGTERDCEITSMVHFMAMSTDAAADDMALQSEAAEIYNAQRERVLDAS